MLLNLMKTLRILTKEILSKIYFKNVIMLNKNQINACATEINDCLKDCIKLQNEYTKVAIQKTVELLNLIHENMSKLTFLENSSMQYSIKIDNEEYSLHNWLNEIVVPHYNIILASLELRCAFNGITLDFNEQTMSVSIR